MSAVSFNLLSHETELSYSGAAVKAGAYYGSIEGLHTVSVSCNNFTGRFYVEGSLSLTPDESDWFALEIEPVTLYKEYTGFSGTEGFTFKANILSIRARVDRDYLAAPTYDQVSHGAVSKSLVNM